MAASRINKSEVTEQPVAIDDTIVLQLRASPADRVRSPLALPGSGAWLPDAPAVRGTHRDGGQRCSAHRSTRPRRGAIIHSKPQNQPGVPIVTQLARERS